MHHMLIVDGSNLLFQMFYGMPAGITDVQGRPIQGTVGFVGALLRVIRMIAPTHVAVLFDGECANPRRQLFADYKANREDFSQLPEEETPFSQLPDIYAVLDCLGICHRETTDCEVDDWIAGYAYRYGRGNRLTILSQDSDFFQLINENVTVLRYRAERSVRCDIPYIQEKLGINPGQYADFKALTGDTSDHIKGAPGIGPKTAAALLQQFGTLEAVLENTHAVKKPSVRSSLQKSAAALRLNYQLIKLGQAVTLPFPLEQMAYTHRDMTTGEVLRAVGVYRVEQTQKFLHNNCISISQMVR